MECIADFDELNEKILDRLEDYESCENVLVANAYISSGCISHRRKGILACRPKNRADRVSTAISPNQVENLIAAACFSEQIGLPMNRYVTIACGLAGIESHTHKPTAKFLGLMGDWLRLRGERFAFIWVREVGPVFGEHVHILMHVQPVLVRAFSVRQRGWLKLCGFKLVKGVIKTKPIGRSYRHAFVGVQYGEQYRYHLQGKLRYLLKGAGCEVAIGGIPLKRSPQGAVQGKRCGTSVNIGETRRREAASSQ